MLVKAGLIPPIDEALAEYKKRRRKEALAAVGIGLVLTALGYLLGRYTGG
jgi:hypothetical protein